MWTGASRSGSARAQLEQSRQARPWMIFTPASALLLMVATGLFGVLAQGLRVAMLLAIASIGAIILRRRA